MHVYVCIYLRVCIYVRCMIHVASIHESHTHDQIALFGRVLMCCSVLVCVAAHCRLPLCCSAASPGSAQQRLEFVRGLF